MLYCIVASKIKGIGMIAMYVGNRPRDHVSVILAYNQPQDCYNKNRRRERKSI
jgi:hypothetical protein